MKTMLFILSASTSIAQIPLHSTNTMQVYASTDFKLWKPRYELAAGVPIPINQSKAYEFYRARPKPSPASVEITSPLQSTGRLYQLTGTASKLLPSLRLGTNIGTITEHTLTGVTWEFPALQFSPGTNSVTLLCRDLDNNDIMTNFNLVIIPGPALTIEYPAPGSMVIGQAGVLIGRVDDLRATVTVNGQSVTICEDGRFYVTGLPLSDTNTWTAQSGTNLAAVTFYRSPVRVSYTVTRGSGHAPLPFIVNGTISDTNFSLQIEGKTIVPNTDGSWRYRGDPPRKGVLLINLISPSSSATSSISVDPGRQWFITAHSFFSRTEAFSNLGEAWKQFSGSLSKGDVRYSMLKYNWDTFSANALCSTDYSGVWPYLLIGDDLGPCEPPLWRIYPATSELANYSNTDTDTFTYTVSSACRLNIGGTPGGNRTVQLAITIYVTQEWIQRPGDEIGGADVDASLISYIGGMAPDSSGTILVKATEGTSIDITPTLLAMNNAWIWYDFDIREF